MLSKPALVIIALGGGWIESPWINGWWCIVNSVDCWFWPYVSGHLVHRGIKLAKRSFAWFCYLCMRTYFFPMSVILEWDLPAGSSMILPCVPFENRWCMMVPSLSSTRAQHPQHNWPIPLRRWKYIRLWSNPAASDGLPHVLDSESLPDWEVIMWINYGMGLFNSIYIITETY